jgi:beta-aspartyl-peptidase (threonine type)
MKRPVKILPNQKDEYWRFRLNLKKPNYIRMKNIILFLVVFLCSSALLAQTNNKYALVLHGGAGVMSEKSMTPAIQKEYLTVLNRALQVGDSVLAAGGTSMDAVVRTIMVMEDSPLFNAGKGAVFTHEGTVELDASVMDGKTLAAGAIAGITDIKNPITLARTVMEKSEHVFLTGKGASQFAVEHGFKLVPNNYFYTDKRLQQLQELLNKEREAGVNDKHGTVGCVALDTYGNIAAGTSTGGMTNKRYGRVGDTPVIGAGTYANNNTGGFSCTGHGEYYIRLGFSRDISAMMEYKQMDIQKACQAEVEKLTRLGGTGGVIGLDKFGNIAMEFNTSGMFRGYIKSTGEKQIAIFK